MERKPIRQGEHLGAEAPTTLHLFRFQGERLSRIESTVHDSLHLKSEHATAQGAYNRLLDTMDKRAQSLRTAKNELWDQLGHGSSSRTAGMAYLAMVDELTPQGLTEQEIMDFYLKCLDINSAQTKWVIGEHQKGYGYVMQKALAKDIGRRNPWAKAFWDRVGASPSWFRGDKIEWELFVSTHSVFSFYLNPDSGRPQPMGSRIADIMKDPLGLTLRESLPDWLTEKRNEIPDRSTVEKEIAEDKEAAERMLEQDRAISRQAVTLLEMRTQRFQKAAVYIESERRNLASFVGSFQELIALLHASENIHEYPIPLEQLVKIEERDAPRFRINPDKSREKAIHRFVQSGLAFSRESVALFIEKRFRAAQIIRNAQDPIDDNFIALFTEVVLESVDKGSHSSQLQELRQANKKAFNVFSSELKPLLGIVPEEDLFALQELAEGLKDQPVEELLFEIAEVVAKSAKEGTRTPDKQSRSAIEDIRRFTGSWIRTHWKWAFEQMQEALGPQVVHEKQQETQAEQVEEAVIWTSEERAPEVVGLEELLRFTEQGNLSGWNLLYATKRNMMTKYMEEVAGDTLEERKEKFKDLLVRNGISCSIGANSVIEALNWLVTVPQEVEQIRKRKRVGDTVFKKLERGAVRILYTMDVAKKEIVFFVHQKKAWSYGF